MKTITTGRWPVFRITPGAAAMAAVVAASMISAGCDSASFVPPSPPELTEPAKPSIAGADGGAGGAAQTSVPDARTDAGKAVRIVELILARSPDPDRVYFDQVLRHELAKVLIPLRLTKPDSAKPWSPADLAGAIRAAVGRGVAGLVVEPRDDAVVADALYDAVSRGVAVVLLDRSVPPRGGKSLPRVEYTEFDQVGRQIVAAAVEANRIQMPAKPGRIVFLHHRSDDPYLERAFQSLRGPALASGNPIEILEFDGDVDQGVAVVQKSLEADPGLGILLADDAVGINVGFRIHVESTESGRRGFLLAGYTADDYRNVTFLDRTYSIGDRSVGSYASQTSRAIRSLMDGKQVRDIIEVPITFYQRSKIPNPPRMREKRPTTGRKP